MTISEGLIHVRSTHSKGSEGGKGKESLRFYSFVYKTNMSQCLSKHLCSDIHITEKQKNKD